MSARSTTKHVRVGVLLLLAAVALSIGLLTVPAAGALTNTDLSAKTNASTITWGGYAIVTGTLKDTLQPPMALGNQFVRVEWSPTGATASWTLLATVTTDPAQYATGQYAMVVYPVQKTYYRFSYLGDGTYGPSISPTLVIAVRPALGVPKVPTSVKHGKNFTVSGSLKPRFPAGAQTVKLTAYRYNGHSWVKYKEYKATNANNGSYTKYSLKLKISNKGKYRFKASTAATPSGSPQPIYASASTDNSSTLKIK